MHATQLLYISPIPKKKKNPHLLFLINFTVPKCKRGWNHLLFAHLVLICARIRKQVKRFFLFHGLTNIFPVVFCTHKWPWSSKFFRTTLNNSRILKFFLFFYFEINRDRRLNRPTDDKSNNRLWAEIEDQTYLSEFLSVMNKWFYEFWNETEKKKKKPKIHNNRILIKL